MERKMKKNDWRIEPFGKELLRISLIEEEKQKDLFTDELYRDIENYIVEEAAQKFREYYNDDEFEDAENMIDDIFGLPAFWCGSTVDDLIVGNILDRDSFFVEGLRLTLWRKDTAEGLMEMLDCIDGCDYPGDFLSVENC